MEALFSHRGHRDRRETEGSAKRKTMIINHLKGFIGEMRAYEAEKLVENVS